MYGIGAGDTIASNVVDLDVADADRSERGQVDGDVAVGRPAHAAPAVLAVDAETIGLVLVDRDHGRAGVDQEAHALAVDRAVGVEMAAALRREDDLLAAALARLAAEVDLGVAEAQARGACPGPRPPHSLPVTLTSLTPCTVDADRDGARLAVDDEDGVAAEAAAHRDRLGHAAAAHARASAAMRGASSFSPGSC